MEPGSSDEMLASSRMQPQALVMAVNGDVSVRPVTSKQSHSRLIVTKSGSFTVSGNAGGLGVSMLLDTGSPISLIPRKIWEAINNHRAKVGLELIRMENVNVGVKWGNDARVGIDGRVVIPLHVVGRTFWNVDGVQSTHLTNVQKNIPFYVSDASVIVLGLQKAPDGFDGKVAADTETTRSVFLSVLQTMSDPHASDTLFNLACGPVMKFASQQPKVGGDGRENVVEYLCNEIVTDAEESSLFNISMIGVPVSGGTPTLATFEEVGQWDVVKEASDDVREEVHKLCFKHQQLVGPMPEKAKTDVFSIKLKKDAQYKVVRVMKPRYKYPAKTKEAIKKLVEEGTLKPLALGEDDPKT